MCKPGDGGVPVCQPGTEQERQDERDCGSVPSGIDLLDPIVSSAGNVSVGSLRADKVFAGPGGCLGGAMLSLDSCELKIGPERDASGALLVKTETMRDTSCASAGFGTAITGVATFSGLPCETTIGRAGYCYAGTFELSITSQTDTFYTGHGALTGAPFHIRAVFCPFEAEAVASCNG